MKKVALGIATVAIAAALAVPTLAFASGPHAQGAAQGAFGQGIARAAGECVDGTASVCAGVCGAQYVDTDGDGVCDNRAAGNGGAQYVDADGDGVCDNRANRMACGAIGGHGSGFGCRR